MRYLSDRADMIIATDDGEIVEVDGTLIKVAYKSQGNRTYKLNKFERSNQDTCINQRVLVDEGQAAQAGQLLAVLDRRELGLANGIRIGLYRVGMLASGFLLMASDWISWHGAFVLAAAVFLGLAVASLAAPRACMRTRRCGRGWRR